jgi:hypothetical protein
LETFEGLEVGFEVDIALLFEMALRFKRGGLMSSSLVWRGEALREEG